MRIRLVTIVGCLLGLILGAFISDEPAAAAERFTGAALFVVAAAITEAFGDWLTKKGGAA